MYSVCREGTLEGCVGKTSTLLAVCMVGEKHRQHNNNSSTVYKKPAQPLQSAACSSPKRGGSAIRGPKSRKTKKKFTITYFPEIEMRQRNTAQAQQHGNTPRPQTGEPTPESLTSWHGARLLVSAFLRTRAENCLQNCPHPQQPSSRPSPSSFIPRWGVGDTLLSAGIKQASDCHLCTTRGRERRLRAYP